MSRRASRRHSFIVTYQFEFHNEIEASQLLECYMEEFVLPESTATSTPADTDFIKAQVQGIRENITFIDDVISRYISGWSFSRIAKVDLTILRLAIYELAFMPEIPTKVCINEAIELAKTFGDDDAPAFINGLLGNAQKELRGEPDPIIQEP